jgi:hypothetical protein
MTLKEPSQLYYLNREIEMDKKRLAELQQKAYGISSSKISSEPRGSATAKNAGYERYVAEIADLEAIIMAKQMQCLHERNRLERYIADIPDSLTRMIFTYRFINGLSWLQVAYHIGGYNTEDSVKKVCYRHIDSENEKERG